MSGLCVSLAGAGHAPLGTVERMLARLAHRARDGQARFDLGRAAAGYARLRVSAGREEPFTDRAGRFCAMDGWLADRAPLERELGFGQEASDPEIVLALLERDGVRGLARLRGEFAIVAWDPAQERLIAARDAMGVKPLFFYHDNSVRIASEPAALVLPGEPKRRLNMRELAMQLVEDVSAPSETLLEGVEAVLPGHAVVWDPSGSRVERLHTISASRRVDMAPADAVAALESALRAAVRDSLPADSPACVFVSGGLDSTTIAALALEETRKLGLPRPLLVTWTYPNMSCDESSYTRELAAHFDVPIVAVEVPLELAAYEPSGPIDLMHEASFAPLVRSMPILNEHDTRVMLSGIGADELFISTGFELEDALADGEWGRALAFAGIRSRPTALRGYRRLGGALARVLVPHEAFQRARGRRWTERTGTPTWMTDRASGLVREGRERRRAFLRPWEDRRISQEYLCAELLAGWQGPRMLEQLDISSQAVGAVARFPFLDSRVVDLFLSLPSRCRYDPAWQKIALRRIAERLLPPSIAWRRSKTVFGDFYRHATYVIEPTVRKLFTESTLEAIGLARPGSLLDLLEAARSPEGFEVLGRQLTGAVAAEVWLRNWGAHCTID